MSGTSISFGTAATFNSAQSEQNVPVYDPVNDKVIISYQDYGVAGNPNRYIVGSVSGTSISWGSPVTYAGPAETSVYASLQKRSVFAGVYSSNGSAIVFDSITTNTNLTSSNYIGLAAEAISNGATGKITTIGGINTQQVGLTTAKNHFVQNTGGLGTLASEPSVIAGTAVSDTKILVWK